MSKTGIKSIIVLFVIALLSGTLLSVANAFLKTEQGVAEINKTYAAEWAKEEVASNAYEHGSVTALGKAEKDGATLYGIVVTTKRYKKIDSCVFTVIISEDTDEIIAAKIIKDGATGGFTLAEYGRRMEDYYIKMPSSSVFENFDGNGVVSSGATYTPKVQNFAFDIAAKYYFGNLRGKNG